MRKISKKLEAKIKESPSLKKENSNVQEDSIAPQGNLLKIPVLKLDKFILILLLAVTFLLGAASNQIYNSSKTKAVSDKTIVASDSSKPDLAKIEDKILPKQVSVNVKWGDLGKKMADDGVIDKKKLAQAVTGSDQLPGEYEAYFTENQGKIELTPQNAHVWLDILWGLGLANKNKLLDEGPMQDLSEGNPENFASTGGYTLGQGDAMTYYSKFSYIQLNDKQQDLVKEIASGIYRPCCGNSAAFPDCNHGMAMLGLIELMVSQNRPKQEIYDTALAFNTLWFPQTYLDIAYHFEKAGRNPKGVPSQELLSNTFSGGQGYSVIKKEVGDLAWPSNKSGGSCGA